MAASVEAPIHLRPMQCFKNGFERSLRLRKNIIVPEAQDAKPVRSEEAATSKVVVRLLDMLASVQLDNDRGFDTSKVANVGTDGMLPAKLEPGHLSPT